MNQAHSAVYRSIVKALAPTAQQPNETPLSILCEPLSGAGASSDQSRVTLHLETGITPVDVAEIAKALSHVQTPMGGAQ